MWVLSFTGVGQALNWKVCFHFSCAAVFNKLDSLLCTQAPVPLRPLFLVSVFMVYSCQRDAFVFSGVVLGLWVYKQRAGRW